MYRSGDFSGKLLQKTDPVQRENMALVGRVLFDCEEIFRGTVSSCCLVSFSVFCMPHVYFLVPSRCYHVQFTTACTVAAKHQTFE